jgi:hypothetical protein
MSDETPPEVEGILVSVPTGDPPDEYLVALGRFVQRCAGVDRFIRYTLRCSLGMAQRQAQLVLGTMSIETIIKLLPRIASIRGVPDRMRNELADALSHYNLIKGLRNKVIQAGVNMRAGQIVTEDISAVHDDAPVQYYVVPAGVLDAASADLEMIASKVAWFGQPGGLAIARSLVAGDPRSRELFEARLRAPWQFKHPPLLTTRPRENPAPSMWPEP